MEDFTRLSDVYDVFFSKVTDDLYMELTYEDTIQMVQELLDNAIQWFEFPRVELVYSEHEIIITDEETGAVQTGVRIVRILPEAFKKFNPDIADEDDDLEDVGMMGE